MSPTDVTDLLHTVADSSAAYLAGLDQRRVPAELTVAQVRDRLDGPLAEVGDAAHDVVRELGALGEVATTASAGPRNFGFVIGGTLPAALGAELLTVAWDQNAAMAVMSPLASVAEEVAGRWIIELLGLPATSAIGFVTGGQSANTTCLAVARHHVLAARGWDVEQQGLRNAPEVTVVVGRQRHATIDQALRVNGFGAPTIVVEADDQGRMHPDELARSAGAIDGPAIICVQAGNVVTGAFDPIEEIVPIARELGAWVHVDGAFGGWAAASPPYQHLTAGMDGADSWAVDGHKMLNVPYDCGYAITAHPESHRATCSSTASYYVLDGEDQPRDGMSWVLDASRRARGISTYAALRSLGRRGVGELIDRCCTNARLFADLVSQEEGIEVLNDVVFNQVVLRFDDDERTKAVIASTQREGTCWAGGATWNGQEVMRVSVANWATTASDIERSAGAILHAHRTA
ncbi:MAG: aminotransferase class V-fold PLP-dependent enzyme [Acidimicrobiales bacterium]|nr:aminotransferase class V-fold PLP-dependent enzyme [Acidimicrobiales bacterium]